MDINKIYEKLKNYNHPIYIRQQKHTWITHVKLYKSNNSNIRQDVLYIVKASDIAIFSQIEVCTNVLFINDIIKWTEDIEKSTVNMLIINYNIDPVSILKKIIAILSENQKLIQNSLSITELLLQGKGIQQILDKACKILNRSLFLDDGAVLIACSINEDLIDIMKEKNIKKHNDRFDDFYDQYKETRSFEKIHTSKTPVYFSGIDDCYFMATNIVVDKNTVAYLLVYECGKDFTDTDLELVALLRNIISLEMQKNKFNCYSGGFLYEPMILDLLARNIEDPLLIEEKAKLLNKEFKDINYILSIEISQDEIDNTIIPYIRYKLQGIVNNSKVFIYKDHIVMIITCDKENPLQTDDLTELNSFLSRNHLHGGLSREFSDFKDLWKYYNQSMKCIELGLQLDSQKTIYSYEDYVHFHMMSICSKQVNIKTFCHPSLTKLFDHDRKNNTNYVRMLYIYLQNKKNRIETANTLNIYRRTVSSRIKKIQELVNIDLNDEELTFHLYFSYKILEYIGEMHC